MGAQRAHRSCPSTVFVTDPPSFGLMHAEICFYYSLGRDRVGERIGRLPMSYASSFCWPSAQGEEGRMRNNISLPSPINAGVGTALVVWFDGYRGWQCLR